VVNEAQADVTVCHGRPNDSFRKLGKAVCMITRAHRLADCDKLSRKADDGSIHETQSAHRIAETLASPETSRAVLSKIFKKYALLSREEDSPDQEAQFPLERLPEVFSHWRLPEDDIPIFRRLLRQHKSQWNARVLPASIGFPAFEDAMLRVLRRVRDRICTSTSTIVSKAQFVQLNARRFEDEYVLGQSCGAGTFGECFCITSRFSGRKRVCKKITKEEVVTPLEEIPEELEALRFLDHPNIVRIFEWFESPSEYSMVLEMANGGDLKTF